MSQTAYRTHHATEVTEQLVGQKVTLAGWVDRRRDHGGVAFIDLRDNSGLVQIVIYDEEMARPLRSEFVIQVTGEVRLRPDGKDVTLRIEQGRVMVMLDGTYASTAFSADWDDDETILSVINELNFGHCAPKSK